MNNKNDEKSLAYKVGEVIGMIAILAGITVLCALAVFIFKKIAGLILLLIVMLFM